MLCWQVVICILNVFFTIIKKKKKLYNCNFLFSFAINQLKGAKVIIIPSKMGYFLYNAKYIVALLKNSIKALDCFKVQFC